jgi:hypothetical protein
MPDAHQVEQLAGAGRGRPLDRPGRRQPEQDAEEAAWHLRVKTSQHVLQRGQLAEESPVLERPADALRRHHVRGQAVEPAAAEGDRPRAQRRVPGDRIEQRRLAGAVRPDDGPHLAGLDAERDPRDRGEPAVAHGDASQIEERHRYSR